MASIDDLPDFLKPVAILIPGETIALMERIELRLRAEWLLELQARMAGEPLDKAQRTGRFIKRVARSKSDFAYSADQAAISERLADARQRGDTQAVAHLLAEARMLEQEHPRVPLDRVTGYAAGVAMKLTEGGLPPIPPRRYSRLFDRKTRRK